MIDRPVKPPQIINVGDRYSGDVDILLNGEKTPTTWFYVDAVAGVGKRYVTDETGHLVRDDDEARTETIHGNFEIVWCSE